MGKNSIRKEEQTPQKNTPLMSIFRVIILIAFVVVMSCTILYFVEMNSDNKFYNSFCFATYPFYGRNYCTLYGYAF